MHPVKDEVDEVTSTSVDTPHVCEKRAIRSKGQHAGWQFMLPPRSNAPRAVRTTNAAPHEVPARTAFWRRRELPTQAVAFPVSVQQIAHSRRSSLCSGRSK